MLWNHNNSYLYQRRLSMRIISIQLFYSISLPVVWDFTSLVSVFCQRPYRYHVRRSPLQSHGTVEECHLSWLMGDEHQLVILSWRASVNATRTTTKRNVGRRRRAILGEATRTTYLVLSPWRGNQLTCPTESLTPVLIFFVLYRIFCVIHSNPFHWVN